MHKLPANLNQQRGFTLVEILLTMVILSMIMLSATYAYNYISQNWQRNQQLYERDLKYYMSTTLMYRAVADTQPKIVYANKDVFGFYFLGRENGFTAYTNTSAQNPAYPAVYRLFSEPAEQGTMQLVYEEALLTNEPLRYAEQQLPFNFRIVVASNLHQVLFEYYGWESMQVRINQGVESIEETREPEWFNEYDGIVRRQHPLTVQVHIGDFIWPISITDIAFELLKKSREDDA